MLKPSILVAGLLTAASLIALAHPALAADLDYGYGDAPPPVAEEKVEFGSGWYIRGDIAATKLPSLSLTAPQTNPNPPVASLQNGNKVGYGLTLGAGYQMTNWFRADVTADFQQPLSSFAQTTPAGAVFCPTGTDASGNLVSGGCTGTFRSQINRYDALVNGYIDLGRWSIVTPYVGAGVGVSFGHYQNSATYIQGNNVPYVNIPYTFAGASYVGNFNRYASGSYQTLAFALMAGVAIDVFDHTKLDVGYRYLNLGSISGVSGTLAEHEIRAGLRYMIDN